jgi:hypothetical protein
MSPGMRDPRETTCEDAASPTAEDPVPERDTAPAPGTLLVRVPAHDRAWARSLPPVPDRRTLTVTLGHADLAPVPVDDLVAGGYRIVGVAADDQPLGWLVDVLVPPQLRLADPAWWRQLTGRSDRIFDLAFGPVARVLAAELDLHLRGLESA